MEDKLELSKLELITIIEDAFCDGWRTRDNDWYCPDDYLQDHKEYGESCETTIALDNLRQESYDGA